MFIFNAPKTSTLHVPWLYCRRRSQSQRGSLGVWIGLHLQGRSRGAHRNILCLPGQKFWLHHLKPNPQMSLARLLTSSQRCVLIAVLAVCAIVARRNGLRVTAVLKLCSFTLFRNCWSYSVWRMNCSRLPSLNRCLTLMLQSAARENSSAVAEGLVGVQPLLKPINARVANGEVLPLQHYDLILGMDWLEAHSSMQIHWKFKWLLIPYQEQLDQFAQSVPAEISSLLHEFAPLFAPVSGLPQQRACDHVIPLVQGAQPVSVRPYRYPPALKDEIESQVHDLLDKGLIQPSSSPFSSPMLLVKKKDGSWRPVVDYRYLNALTVRGKLPIPVFDEMMDELAGSSWFSSLDLNSGFHQIRLKEGEEFKTAFQTHFGHFEFKVMSFGLCGAPGTFQGAMNATLQPVLRRCALVFFDDILVYSQSFADHLTHLHLLARDQWQVKLSKCTFAQRQIAYLGRVISQEGVSTDPSKSFSKRGTPLAFISRPLGPKSAGLSTYEKEYMAILMAVEQWQSYLQHREFLIFTDQRNLVHLSDQRLNTPWQQRVFTKLLGLQYKVLYKPGPINRVADALSRRPHADADCMALSVADPVWIADILKGYESDPEAQSLIAQLAVSSDSIPHFSLHDGLLRYHPQSDGQTERVNQCMETFLRCYVHACSAKWYAWLSLAEYWYNTRLHSALGTSPFEALYGRPPRSLGLTPVHFCPAPDLSQWLQDRELMSRLIQQHLHRARLRMKRQADKHRSERTFEVGDRVFVKIQPYVQSSLAPRSNQKLAFKFFGPFTVESKINDVAYKVFLPVSSSVHPVFHVSMLKKAHPAGIQPSGVIPDLDSTCQFPVRILNKRFVQKGTSSVSQVLVQWSGWPESMATWEDHEALFHRFPAAPAWGHAGSKGGGDVTTAATDGALPTEAPADIPVSEPEAEDAAHPLQSKPEAEMPSRPRRGDRARRPNVGLISLISFDCLHMMDKRCVCYI
ncbi:hypothetical protein U9M48_006242 [Paspalum notatum var. saurae]|uniref:Reverse transcriptase n=1 Tax=Paspalum notatum var. saurae TaxID=547442 RepID=A0AAQ3PP16_PASNO